MTDVMKFAALILGVPTLFIGLYLVLGWIATQPSLCPHCGRRGLRMKNHIRASIEINGQRAPDSWAYFQCEFCYVRLKQHLGKPYETPTESEWDQHCRS